MDSPTVYRFSSCYVWKNLFNTLLTVRVRYNYVYVLPSWGDIPLKVIDSFGV